MCGKLAEALGKEGASYGYANSKDESLSFVNFFATPIEDLDDMAAAIIDKEGVEYEDLVTPVRLLQEYEVMFWDGIFEASEKI